MNRFPVKCIYYWGSNFGGNRVNYKRLASLYLIFDRGAFVSVFLDIIRGFNIKPSIVYVVILQSFYGISRLIFINYNRGFACFFYPIIKIRARLNIFIQLLFG